MKLDFDKFIIRKTRMKLSYGKLAELLGVCRTTLWNKVNGYTDFKGVEIGKMKTIFGNDIFLQ